MKPVVLLIPGTLCDAALWDEVTPALAAHAQPRIAEIRGADSIEAMARACWQAVADVPEGVPLIVAGFSLGGYVALEMLVRPRRALAAAALVSTSARPEPPEAASHRAKAMQALREDFARAVEATLRFTCSDPSPEMAGRLRRMMHRVGAPTALRQHRAIAARADHRQALAALALPVQVLCGDADRVTPPALSHELAALIPGAQFQRVEGAGHMLPCERPQAVVSALATLATQSLHLIDNDRRRTP